LVHLKIDLIINISINTIIILINMAQKRKIIEPHLNSNKKQKYNIPTNENEIMTLEIPDISKLSIGAYNNNFLYNMIENQNIKILKLEQENNALTYKLSKLEKETDTNNLLLRKMEINFMELSKQIHGDVWASYIS